MENNVNNLRPSWANSFVFIMVTIGAAVGLGNVWKFPYMVGSYGGSAFVLVYLICIILVSLPLTLAEIVTGKIARVNPFFCYEKLFQKFSYKENFFDDNKTTTTKSIVKYIYKFASWLLVIAPILYTSLYCVIGGWVLEYFLIHSFSGFADIATAESSADTFKNLIATPTQTIFMSSLFIFFGSIIVLFGIEKGISKANAVMVPGLFFILLFLLGFGIYYGNFDAACEYLFAFNLDAALSWEVFFAAMSQTFFSISLGVATLMLYGSHLKNETKNLSGNVVSVIIGDTTISLLSALLVFSFLFSNGSNSSITAGPSLVFEALPIIFSKIPLATIIAPLFCLFLIFASLSTLISLLEPPIGFFIERYPKVFNRFSATMLVAILNIIISSIISLAMAKKFDINIDLFDFADKLVSGFMLPLNAFFNAIFLGFILSWIAKNYLTAQQNLVNIELLRNNLYLSPKLFSIFMFLLKYISPLAILLIFFAGLS